MRLSITTKIFAGFLVVLATFGGVTAYNALTMRRLGDELRLVSRGYLELRLAVSELQTTQSNLLSVLVEQLGKPDARVPLVLKFGIDAARSSRLKKQMPTVLGGVRSLEALRSTPEEHAFLNKLRTRLEQIESMFHTDEALFDEVYGPIGDLAPAGGERARASAERLRHHEEAIKRQLTTTAAELRLRAQQAGLRLEEDENRSVYATLLLAVVVVLVGSAVMMIAVRTVSPLRRLAERAQSVARGDYKQRVDASARDEIGALGREFNAMAAALDEREARLIRSERLAAVGKIAAQITHEVRNPLSSIGLNAELLEEELGALGGEQALEAQAIARAIVKEVDRLTDITEQYLRFARLPRPTLEREDLGAIVSSLLSFQRTELAERKIAVELDVPSSLPQVAVDEQQLRQALLNLMRNASEAMAGGGRLTIRARRDGDLVVLAIADSGQGIAPEHVAKVFDPFFSTKEGGTGLGLALTQQIVVEHGGTIDVVSEPGRGTTFTVRLPALAPIAAVAGGELARDGARE
jgi:signal transduction histidine kinase